jgi:hypothetical protein
VWAKGGLHTSKRERKGGRGMAVKRTRGAKPGDRYSEC